MTIISDIFYNIVDLLTYHADKPMLFSSGLFWALFLIFIPIYSSFRSSRLKMTLFVIFFSLFFYYKSSGLFFLLLVGTSLVDWLLSRLIVLIKWAWLKKLVVFLSIAISLSVLGYFKYANFFLWNWNAMVQGNFQLSDIILPVGISFYTFQSISYIVDVYRGTVKPTESWWDYLFFLSFFPSLVAGPIVRADYFLPQIRENRQASTPEVYAGLWLIIIGVVKKAIIADYISQYNDLIFDTPGSYTGFEALMGVIGYTMQIYCDFSGYSDMAIGIAAIMGFRLPPNFNMPYKSQSLTEFWRRWHISLSTWLRDYLYIPLGGNRKGTFRLYLNNFLTMAIGGLWHGAAWKFVFWGAMHGVGLIVNKMCRPFTSRFDGKIWFSILSWAITLIFVSLLWVFFRAASWSDSCVIIASIFKDFSFDSISPFLHMRYLWVIMMSVIILSHCLSERWCDFISDLFVKSPWFFKFIVFIVVVQLVIELQSAEVAPFIYYQF